jgi:hypothetical protein
VQSGNLNRATLAADNHEGARRNGGFGSIFTDLRIALMSNAVASTGDPSCTTPARERDGYVPPRQLAFGAIAMFALLVIAYSFSISLRATNNAAITGDEPFYLLTTQSLLQDGDLDLRSQYAANSYSDFFDYPGELWQQSVPLSSGAILSPHEPGTSLLVLPGFALWGLRGAQWTLLLVAAATFALTYLLVALETKAPLVSWLVTAVVALSATAFVYSTEIYPEVPGALCIVLSLLLLRSGRRDTLAGVVLLALLTVFAWFGIKYVFLGGPLALHFLWQAQWPARRWFIGLGAASGVAYIGLHLLIFDHLVPYSVNTVYEGAGAVSVLEAHVGFGDRFYRLWGLFTDARFGIGRWAPLFLLVLPALPLLLGKGHVGLTVTSLIIMQVLIATFLAVTMMGFWFPGRTLMTVLPLFAIVIVNLLLRLPRSALLVVAVLSIATLLNTASLYHAVHDGPQRLAFDPFTMKAWFWDWTAQLFPDYRFWDAYTWQRTIAWLGAFFGAGVWWSWREYGTSVASMLSRNQGRVAAALSGLRAGAVE